MRSADELRSYFALVSEDELATMLDIKLETLRAWRTDKQGPRWIKLGKGVYYRDVDVFEWIDASGVPSDEPVKEAA